jgi:zinc protease
MGLATKVTSIFGWMLVLTILSYMPGTANAMEDKLKQFTLTNGLKVLVKEDHARKVATVQLWVMVGSADEEKSELGISHLIEHMAFKGTERRGVGQIAAEIEALGGETNAYTSWDETVFHVTVPSHAVSQGMDILTDAVLRPSIDAGELDKEKQVVIEEILEGEERPERKASKLLFKTAYVTSPYQYPVIGYKETVEKFTRKDVLDFRKKWYVPENMFMLVVGDVDADKIREDAEKYTADLKPVGFFRPPRAQEPSQKEIRSAAVKDRNARETRLLFAFHIPGMKGVDVNALDLTGDLLGARDNSRLVRSLKNEKKLVNSISAHAITPKEPGLMVISATLDAKNLEAVTTGVMEEIKRLKKEPPSSTELQDAKIHIESQHIYSRETVQGMARNIGSLQADLGDAGYEPKYLALNNAVTPEQISTVVKEYLVPPNVSVAVLIPEESGEGFRVEKLTEIVKSFGPEKKEVATEATLEAKTVVKTLPNGMTLVMTPDESNPAVSFRIAFLGGKRFETKETEGAMNFIAQMLNKGTTKMSEVEIATKVDEMGGRLSGFSGYDSFGFSATFFSRYLDLGIDLLAHLYTDSAFPEDKLERERALILSRIKTEPDRPVQYAVNVLGETLFPHHPYGFNKDGTLATVSGFTPADLKSVYKRFAVPANTVISMVGDFDAKGIDRLVEAFGKIPTVKPDFPDAPKENPLTKQRDKVVKIPRAKAHLAIGFRGTTVADEDRYPMEVLNNALSGQGGRLFRELRDKQSLAYSVTSFVRPAVEPGLFAFYIACDVSKVDRALAGLYSEIERIKKEPLGDEELKRSINNLVGNHLISLQSSWSRAENRALNTLYGLGYDYETKYIRKVSEVKTEDVLRVARKYLDVNHSALVKILPEENESKQK